MIDVHMIVMPDTDPMKRAMITAQLAMEGVELHVIDGIAGNLRLGRKRGYAAGTNPWVTYVDPDDQIERGIFTRLRTAIERHPEVDVVGCNEYAKFGNIRRIRPMEISRTAINRFHHLTTYRREAVADLDYVEQPELGGIEFLRLTDMLCRGKPFVYLDRPGYIWTADNPRSYSKSGMQAVVNMQLLADRLREENPLGLIYRKDAEEPIEMRPFSWQIL